MGSDLSALDAELDTLGAGPTVDVLQLARTYAGVLASSDEAVALELTSVDAALSELDSAAVAMSQKRHAERAERVERVRRSTTPPPLPSRRAVAESQRAEAASPQSEEIVLPEPVVQAPGELGSGELPLHNASRSGAFSVEHASKKLNHDDTVEPFDDELVESDVDMVEFSHGAPANRDTSGDARESQRSSPLFDLNAPNNVEAQQEADAAFAELFADATRHSNMPSSENNQAPEQYNDDTETFDSSALSFIESNASASAGTVNDEELDSAEFEIVMDADGESAPSVPAPRASEAEKRPSFLGRLFGRKED
jgi:hypothetical protein